MFDAVPPGSSTSIKLPNRLLLADLLGFFWIGIFIFVVLALSIRGTSEMMFDAAPPGLSPIFSGLVALSSLANPFSLLSLITFHFLHLACSF